MKSRWFIAPLAAAALVFPSAAAFAQAPPADSTTTETSEAAAAFAVLEQQLADIALSLVGLRDEDSEARANVVALVSAAAEQVSIGASVITAKADDDEDGAISDGEAVAVIASLEDDEDGDDEAGHGDLVRRVAECAPRGQETVLFLGGLKNHGKWVSAAAHGATVELAVPDLSSALTEGEDGTLSFTSTTVSFDLSDPAGVEDLCAAFGVLAAANQLWAEATGEDLPKKNDAKKADKKNDATEAEKRAEKDARSEDRDAAKADRDAAKTERRANKPADDADDADDSDDA